MAFLMQWNYGVTHSYRCISCHILSSIRVVGPWGRTHSIPPVPRFILSLSKTRLLTHSLFLSHQGIHFPANHCNQTIAVPLTMDMAIRIVLTLHSLYTLPTRY